MGEGTMRVTVNDREAWFWTDGCAYCFSIDDLRRIYCAALGVEMWGTTIQEELDAVNAKTHVSVDMPEDILKAKKVMELNGAL